MTREHLRTAWRTLVREPSFTIVAILTFGTAIGANVAVLALVDAALIQALPYPSPGSVACRPEGPSRRALPKGPEMWPPGTGAGNRRNTSWRIDGIRQRET